MRNFLRIGFFIFLLGSLNLTAQTVKTTTNKKALKYYKLAEEKTVIKGVRSSVDKDQYSQNVKAAYQYLKTAIKIDSNFAEAYFMAAECCSFLRENETACQLYTKGLSIKADFPYRHFYYAAHLYMDCGKPDTAKLYFEKYFNRHPASVPIRQEAIESHALCQWRIELMKNPIDINLKNMGDNINSEWDEYLPAITADESEFIFTVRRPRDKNSLTKTDREEDFFVSKKVDGVYQKRQYLSDLNTPYNEGAQCISPDGRYLIFTACERDGGLGRCDLYWSKRTGDKWSKPRNCGSPVNTEHWETQPTFSADGKTIYFVSNRPGGVGKNDIWKTTMISDGLFSTPINLGEPVNTPDDEQSPFIHPGGRTLYFASRGHKGLGDFDIFVSQINKDGSWGEPVNMGYPINTHREESNFIVNAKGDKAFFSSDIEGGVGLLDLYWSYLPKHLQPTPPVTFFKGKIFDAKDERPLAALFEVIDLKDNSIVVSSISDPVTGEFLVCIPINSKYALNALHDKYLFFSETFEIDGQKSHIEPYYKDVALKRIEVGQSIVLKNIFFDTDQSTLKEESENELHRILKLMTDNPKMRVELSGHTDNVGSTEHNNRLSTDRAKAVFDYLIDKGISKDRLSYKGYGLSKPIDNNDTEEGRANNRRTEFTIVGF